MKKAPERGLFRARNLEARVGIEPTHKGFADLSLTTWVPRLVAYTRSTRYAGHKNGLVECTAAEGCFWSGRPGSNRRHLPWQGSTLPLSYSRPASIEYSQNPVGWQRRDYCGVVFGAVPPGGKALRCGAAFGGSGNGFCGAGCCGGGGGS